MAEQNQSNIKTEDLILSKGRREALENLVIRPNIVGKRTLGNLELHHNGLRFSTNKGHRIDIVYSNVRHAFYQPCWNDEQVVILHFHLKQPILVGTKKVIDL